MIPLIITIYTIYAILSYYGQVEIFGRIDMTMWESVQVLVVGFLNTPYALFIISKALLSKGQFVLLLQDETTDPKYDKKSWTFSTIINVLLILIFCS